MNHLYDMATGRLISSGSEPILDIAPGRAVKASDLTGIWNESTLDFDPAPVKRMVTKLEFMERFTDTELEAITSMSKKDTGVGNKVSVFMKKLDLADQIDLDDARLQAGVNGMESLGLIGAGRAAVILNG